MGWYELLTTSVNPVSWSVTLWYAPWGMKYVRIHENSITETIITNALGNRFMRQNVWRVWFRTGKYVPGRQQGWAGAPHMTAMYLYIVNFRSVFTVVVVWLGLKVGFFAKGSVTSAEKALSYNQEAPDLQFYRGRARRFAGLVTAFLSGKQFLATPPYLRLPGYPCQQRLP